MRIACIVMQRNEDLCLHPWLVYHGHLFGYENLFVIDHGSDRTDVKATLSAFEARGVHVARLPAAADYRAKGEFVSEMMARADETADYDFLLPLDCDEFVTMRDAAGQPSCDRDALHDYLRTLADETAPLQVRENFLNMLGHRDTFFALPYQKVFFTGGNVGVVDHGSHFCTSAPNTPMVPTRLVHAHFHHKAFDIQLQMAREKLLPYVDVDDRVALEAYCGTGWHLVSHMLKTEDEYMRIMRPDARCIQFPALNALFERLGVDPGFAEG
jgi:hypothetical protein